MLVFMSCLSESFLSEIPEGASESFLFEVVFRKLFRPKVFNINESGFLKVTSLWILPMHKNLFTTSNNGHMLDKI